MYDCDKHSYDAWWKARENGCGHRSQRDCSRYVGMQSGDVADERDQATGHNLEVDHVSTILKWCTYKKQRTWMKDGAFENQYAVILLCMLTRGHIGILVHDETLQLSCR